MILHIRNGANMFEVCVPERSLVQFSATGRPVLVIPGPTLHDTAAWLSAPRILEAARAGQYGLRLVAEHRAPEAPSRPVVDRRAAG